MQTIFANFSSQRAHHHEREPKGVGIATDLNDGPDQYNLPPPSKEGAVPLPKDGDGQPTSANGVPPEQERWARDRVGWEPRFGTGETAEEKEDTGTLLDHQTFLEGKLDEKFYGGGCENSSGNHHADLYRLVSQRGSHRLLMLGIVGCCTSRWGPWMDLHRNGDLRILLSNFSSKSQTKFPGRHQSRIGQDAARIRFRESRVDQQLSGQVLANLCTKLSRIYHCVG
jgi:hypothetical protein